MRTLIIPDVHLKIDKVNFILKNSTYDKVIFLGDYFDDFNDTEIENKKVAVWLKENLDNPNFTFLFGNHDIAYAYPANPHLRCPGFNADKNIVINKVLKRYDWNKLHFFHYQDNFLFSHAGLLPYFFDKFDESCLSILRKESEKAYQAAGNLTKHSFFDVGRARGGNDYSSGLLWTDWTWEFKPTEGLGQICGHTHSKDVRSMKAKNSENHCLDTHLSHVGYLTDGKFSFEYVDYTNLKK